MKLKKLLAPSPDAGEESPPMKLTGRMLMDLLTPRERIRRQPLAAPATHRTTDGPGRALSRRTTPRQELRR